MGLVTSQVSKCFATIRLQCDSNQEVPLADIFAARLSARQAGTEPHRFGAERREFKGNSCFVQERKTHPKHMVVPFCMVVQGRHVFEKRNSFYFALTSPTQLRGPPTPAPQGSQIPMGSSPYLLDALGWIAYLQCSRSFSHPFAQMQIWVCPSALLSPVIRGFKRFGDGPRMGFMGQENGVSHVSFST